MVPLFPTAAYGSTRSFSLSEVFDSFPEEGEPRAEVHLFGRLAGNDRELRDHRPCRETWARVIEFAASFGIVEILAPKPVFGRRVCSRVDLGETITHQVFDSHLQPVVKRGCEADAVILEKPEQAAWFSTSGCLVAIFEDENSGLVAVAHLGRDCLVDRERIFREGKRKPFLFESMIDLVLKKFKDPSRLRVALVCGTGPKNFLHPWDHPKHAKFNQRFYQYVVRHWGMGCFVGLLNQGALCLSTLAREQMTRPHGPLEPEQIWYDGVDTYNDIDVSQEPLWHDLNRDRKAGLCTADSFPCNGVLVVRRRK